MQTFVPYPCPKESAACLDTKRLGKQRVEAMQILKALRATDNNSKYGWKNHPATLMWKGHTQGLVYYTVCMIDEWKNIRSFADTIDSFLYGFAEDEYYKARILKKQRLSWQELKEMRVLPQWFGGIIHATHKSALLQKFPEHYEMFKWNVPVFADYYWPCVDDKGFYDTSLEEDNEFNETAV